jgi:filamentous hemagglutinin family protein
MFTTIKYWLSNYAFNNKIHCSLKTASYLLGFILIFQPSLLHAQQAPAQQAPAQPAPAQQAPAQKVQGQAVQTNNPTITPGRPIGGRSLLGIWTDDNGVYIINIVAPGENSRLSHNYFTKFSVLEKGAVLNNSKLNADPNLGPSELAGQIATNPNLDSSQQALVILNEVQGSNKSMLNGKIEVHGLPADVIIANRNGIYCDGCGFINAPTVTLTTGRPRFNGVGALETLGVTQGKIIIDTQGLVQGERRKVNVFNLVSRTISVRGPIRVRDKVNLIAGKNTYNYQTGRAIALSSNDNEQGPSIGIDSTVMGGMYAGRIKIVSNDQGAGVKADGSMVANANGVTLTANGDLTFKDIQSTKPGGESQQADAGNISITASTINLDRTVDNNTEALNATGNITLNADNISAQKNRITALGTLDINSSKSIDLNGGIYYAGGALKVEGEDITTSAELNSENTATLSSTVAGIENTGKVAGDEGTFVDAKTTFDNEGRLYSAKKVDVTSKGDTENKATGKIFGYESVEFNVATLDNDGTINGNNNLIITASSIDNAGRAGSARGNLDATVTNNITNTNLFYSGISSIFRLGGTLTNIGANIVAETNLTIRGMTRERATLITSRSGNLEAISGMMKLAASTVTVQTLTPRTNLGTESFTEIITTAYPRERDLITRDVVVRSSQSRILAGTTLTIDALTVNNHNSQIAANDNVSINANSVNLTGNDLSQTSVRTTTRRRRDSYCAQTILGICTNEHHFYVDVDSTAAPRREKYSKVATIESVGSVSLSAPVMSLHERNTLLKNSVLEGITHIPLSSGSNRKLDPVSIDEVRATKNLVDIN